MQRHFSALFIACVTLSVSPWAACAEPERAGDDSCLYSEENQIKELSEIAQKHPGAVLNKRESTVSFSVSKTESIRLVFSGCNHLESTVTLTTVGRATFSEETIFQKARQLATDYWDTYAKRFLDEGLESPERTMSAWATDDGERNLFDLPSGPYSEIWVEYIRKGTMQSVSISYTRIF
jgi:hypothetical protein